MDARELTKAYEQLSSQYRDTKRTVEYLEQEVSKLRLLVDDLRIEAEMNRNIQRR